MRALSVHIVCPTRALDSQGHESAISRSRRSLVRDVEIVGRTLARSLWQTGNTNALHMLRDFVGHVSGPTARADLLLELAEVAAEYDNAALASNAANSAASLASDDESIPQEDLDYLRGKLARVRAVLATSTAEATSQYQAAETLLTRSLAIDASSIDAQSALAHTLADLALTHFARGELPSARQNSQRARGVIERFQLTRSAKTVETLAFDAVLQAFYTGIVGTAKEIITSLLPGTVESGWCSTTTKLIGYLIGMSSVGGDYAEAIEWYERMSSTSLMNIRPRERALLAQEAAHAYTMSGRPQKALSILNDVAPGSSSHRSEAPTWFASIASALERMGCDAPALVQAQRSLEAYTAMDAIRGIADAHRLIATCNAKLGNGGAAKEHILEAVRLVETHGTPYALLRALVAKSDICGGAADRSHALELARLLRTLAK